MTQNKKRLKLAILIRDFVKTGGAEKYTVEVTQRLAREHEVHVFSQSWNFDGKERIFFHRIPRFFIKPSILNQLIFSYFVRKAVDDTFDIIHSHALRSYQEDIASIFSLIKKKPMIISPHGGISINWDYSDKVPKMISDKTFGYLKKKLLNIHYIAVTKMEIPLIKKYGSVDEDHIHYIPHGVNLDTFKPSNSENLKKELGLENSDVLLYVGRIAKGKGVDKLVKILNLIHKKNKNIKLVVIGGDAGYLHIVKTLISKYNLSKKVIFLGYISKKDLSKYYALADLVIYPSRQEIFGLVLCEAMACGKAVIGSDIFGPSEIIINGETGYTSNFQNLEDLSNKIMELLKDKDKLNYMGKKGLERVIKHYTWKMAAEKHLLLYKKLINR